MDNVSLDVSQVMAIPGISMVDRINALTAAMMHTHSKQYCYINLEHKVRHASIPFRKMDGEFTKMFEGCFGVYPKAFLVFGNDVMVMHHTKIVNGKFIHHVIIAVVTGKESVEYDDERVVNYKITFSVIAPIEDIGIYEAENDRFTIE